MTDYITVADVDDLLPIGWEAAGDKTRAVLEANTWLTSRGVMASEPVEYAVRQAGAYLAERAASGSLYADNDPALKRKRVKAGSVESENEYQDGSTPSSGAMRLVIDLLRPFLPAGGGSNFAVTRG